MESKKVFYHLLHFFSHSGASNQGVSLKCNQTVEVVAGETVTINCTIYKEEDCRGVLYFWKDTHDDQLCDGRKMEYKCEWDSLTYVSLIISNIMKEEKYSVHVYADCGDTESSVTVQVKQQSNGTNGE